MSRFYVIVIIVITLLFVLFLFKIFNKSKAKVDAELKASNKEVKNRNDSLQADKTLSKEDVESEDPTIQIRSDDKEIERFSDTAQKHLPYLINFMKENGNDTTFYKYFLKTKFCEQGECEHMWVQVFSYKKELFTGTLSNDPAIIKLVKFGDKIQVRRSEVEDWLLIDDLLNVKVGGYSQDYIRTTEQ